jgi:(p)ppGpp synthase/HD superfamily hydrolase
MKENTNLNRAQEFARKAHAHITGTSITGVVKPQIHHIQEVADLVWVSGGTDNEIIAAWLHDSVEDTEVGLDEIEKEFGKEVRVIVEGLTDHDHYKDLPLQERKRLQAERLRNETDSVRRVKIADQTSNVRGLTIDPINSMNSEECYHYIRGAKLLADECRGVSDLLDNLFDQAYTKGIARFSDLK